MSKIEVNQISSQCGSTLTIGQSGDTVTLACGATQTGFGRTGTVNWDTTAKTASFTAVSGNGYFVNTTSGSITVTLPAGSAGDIVSLADYAATWQTNNVTVTPDGTDKIGGVNVSVTLNTEGQSVTFVYTDSTQGWINTMDSTSNVRGNPFIVATGGTITTCGDYKIHTFTSPGTFCVSAAGLPANANVDYLVVAGGGGGANRDDASGGGGAGGYRESSGTASGCYSRSPLGACVSALPVSVSGYPITVGGGGSSSAPQSPGCQGSNSVFSTITSTGGGYGAMSSGGPGTPDRPGGSGGSGGGAGTHGAAVGSAGSGNTPPVSPPQGQNGGRGSTDNATYRFGGGGGGAGAVGGSSPSSTNTSTGGNGLASSITGSSVTRAGGGGAGTHSGAPAGDVPGAAGGSGGGGAGGGPICTPATAGTANTGGGGGGSANGPSAGGAGGSGIVVIRYKYQ